MEWLKDFIFIVVAVVAALNINEKCKEMREKNRKYMEQREKELQEKYRNHTNEY